MTRVHDGDRTSAPALEAALQQLVPLFSDCTRLPEPADLLRRARLRERALAAERLARWHARIRSGALGLLAIAAAGATYATGSQWSVWLLQPLVESPPMPGTADAAVLAGAVLVGSALLLWTSQQFAEE